MFRDFDTVYSNVRLKNRGVLNFDAGYKVFDYHENKSPKWIGHKKNLKWYIYDTADTDSSYAPQVFLGAAVAMFATFVSF